MIFAAYLESFSEYPVLQQRVLFVLEQLPSEVQRDFLEDARFGVTIDNYEPETGWSFSDACAWSSWQWQSLRDSPAETGDCFG